MKNWRHVINSYDTSYPYHGNLKSVLAWCTDYKSIRRRPSDELQIIPFCNFIRYPICGISHELILHNFCKAFRKTSSILQNPFDVERLQIIYMLPEELQISFLGGGS